MSDLPSISLTLSGLSMFYDESLGGLVETAREADAAGVDTPARPSALSRVRR